MPTIRISTGDQRTAENVMFDDANSERKPGQLGSAIVSFATSRPQAGFIDYHRVDSSLIAKLAEKGIRATLVSPPAAPPSE
ncbi:hypothetical protein WH240_12030 [Gluconobacter wancherniae]|uniref:hypothetical protein n=1 Tax=Gluconobacter wancherniae TaxID=1307955 RepID=UPI001B8B7075|nr:hypothetical protein [Gluconobacter wancherniae]MBS1063922.1 hypothetical protein [Gluconobacter wancherniae]